MIDMQTTFVFMLTINRAVCVHNYKSYLIIIYSRESLVYHCMECAHIDVVEVLLLNV